MNPLLHSRALIFLAGILLGGGAASGILLGVSLPNLGTYAAPPAPAPSATSTLDASGAVSVEDQPAGSSVIVESVTVPPPGVWVAVQDLNANGMLGNVLGAAKAGGPRENVAVPLLRSTIAGREYAIVLYRDDGDGAFDVGKDSIYVDFDSGQPVETSFTAK